MKSYLENLFTSTSTKLEFLANLDIQFNVPQDTTHGDYSTNVAMLLTKALKRNPREIAKTIIENLELDNSIISKVEIAGPGFINFYFTPNFVNKLIKKINSDGSEYGLSKKYNGKKANVEFVSANPTGPLTVGHGRNAVLGDTIAKLLESVGYSVDREYYFNNAGRQMRVLGDSVAARYMELLGEEGEFAEEFYQGEYIKDIAQKLVDQFGDSLKNKITDEIFKNTAEE